MSTSATSSNDSNPIIEVRGLKHSYRKSKKVHIEAIQGIDLTVEQGEIVALVGPDGAGKSTLLKALSGLIHPDEGTVTLAGETPGQVRELIGYVSQSGGVDPDLTVLENLTYIAGLHSLPSGIAEERYEELLNRLHLEPVADRLVASIGGGRRRLLTLAGELLPDPDFIFLDEPTTAIDPMSRRAVWELLFERASAGKTIVLATQFAWEADQCTRIAFMSGGTISHIGTPREIRDRISETDRDGGTADQLRRAFDSAIAGLEKHRPPPFPFARPVQQKFGDVAIRAEGLARSFGNVEAVQGIDLEVRSGEIFGLVGESGAGKSSILKMLAGLLTADDGYCEISGEDSSHSLDYESRRHIGYLPQSFALFGELTVDDNLEFLAGIHQVPADEFERKRQWIYELLSLTNGGKTLVDSLEVSEKRRLAFAAAVLHEPDILLLDGPTTTLDPLMRQVLWDVLEGFAAHGTAVLLATPYLSEAERCDRVGLLSDGKLLAVGTPAELRSAHEANVVEFDAAPSAVAILRGMLKPWRVWPVAGRIHAIADGDAQTGVRELSQQLSEVGIVMERVQTRPLSLEDVSVLLTADRRGRTLV